MSGGADSSYLLHLCVKELGLRPLVFHVDCGWNSDIATNNINVMIEKLDLDLYTEVINWKEIREFQLAYFKSGLSNIDVLSGSCFVATLYNFAQKNTTLNTFLTEAIYQQNALGIPLNGYITALI